MGRQRRVIEIWVLMAIAGALLLAGTMVGCGSGVGEENADGRGGERGSAATTDGVTTAPGEDRQASGAARGQASLDAEVVFPGDDYLPAGFGEGSLWASAPITCNDGGTEPPWGSNSPSSSGGASFSASAQMTCELPNKSLLKRLDPRTGEELATITLEDFPTNTTEVAVGAGSVWVTSGSGEAGIVIRVDPETNRVVDRIPVGSPTGLAFGHGSVWVTSSGRGTLSRVDPRTGEVAEEIEVGRGALDVAVDDGSETVWVASGSFSLWRIPSTTSSLAWTRRPTAWWRRYR